mgnify:FL=1
MIRFAILILSLALLAPIAEARYTIARTSASAASKRHARNKIRRTKPRRARTLARPVAQDWDSVMRRNTPETDEARMMPEEYRQWMRNLNDAELDLYLKFRVTDAIPFAEVEAEAKRRKIR